MPSFLQSYIGLYPRGVATVFIKALKLEYSENGTVISGSATIIDVVHIKRKTGKDLLVGR